MQQFVAGIFTSKLRYALPLIGTIWGTPTYNQRELNKYSFTKTDLLALQSLQRQAAQIVRGIHKEVSLEPTKEELDGVGWQSVNQLVASSSLLLLHRMIRTGKPATSISKLERRTNSRTAYKSIQIPLVKLNLTMESFFQQAIRLHNCLPEHIKDATEIVPQKKLVNGWVLENVPVKP